MGTALDGDARLGINRHFCQKIRIIPDCFASARGLNVVRDKKLRVDGESGHLLG